MATMRRPIYGRLALLQLKWRRGSPPLADLHPMRVLFIIPRENPPQLDEHFTRPMKEFVSLCLQKAPIERPSAKELLKHRFIRTARKSPRLLDRIKERPKYQVKDDIENIRSGLKAYGEGSGTVKVLIEQKSDGTVRSSNQGKTFRNAGWDFSLGGAQSTGTVRSVVRPPPVRAKREENSIDDLTPRRTSDGDSQWLSAPGNGLHESSEVSLGRYSRDEEEGSLSGSGTVVVRSPRGRQSSSSIHSGQSSQSNRTHASFEDTSSSGTLVRSQRDESESPQTPKSRLGLEERSSSSYEDSAANLAEAMAAIQKGSRKGVVRERPVSNRVSKDVQEKSDQKQNSSESPRRSHEYLDAQKPFSRSPKSDDDVDARMSILKSSTSLSVLLIPSLKEVITEDSEGIARAITNALVDMERKKLGSSEVLMSRLLHRLGSCRDPSLKDLQELSVHVFSRAHKDVEQSNLMSDAESKKKQLGSEFLTNPNTSPLARFLLLIPGFFYSLVL